MDPVEKRLKKIREGAKNVIRHAKTNSDFVKDMKERAADAFRDFARTGSLEKNRQFWQKFANASSISPGKALSNLMVELAEDDATGNTCCKTVTTEFIEEIARLNNELRKAKRASTAKKSVGAKKSAGAKKTVGAKKTAGSKKAKKGR